MNIVTLSEEQRGRLSDDEFNQREEHAMLLHTGVRGDCVVSSGILTLVLHSNILCSRSEYFRAAFQGGFKEGKDRFLDLQEVVAGYFVGLVIKYLYLSSKSATTDISTYHFRGPLTVYLLPVPRLPRDLEIVYGPMNDVEFYEIFLELYRHAAFFRVQDLKDAIMRELQNRLDESAMTLVRAGQDALFPDPEVARQALQDFMTAAVSAFDKSNFYYDFYEPVRSEVFRFVERYYPVLSGMGEEFDDYLRQAPELSLAILKRMSHIDNSKFITPGPQVRCQFCNSPINVEPPHWHYQPEFGITAARNGSVKYFCSASECFRKIRVKSCFPGE
ncbi:Kelch-like [Diaporthe eres]